MTLDITAIDFFCGAGGSSTDLVAAGIEVKGAANHWRLAIETHNTNHPHTEHYLDDLQQAHPSWYPRTDIAWFSPECTNHSAHYNNPVFAAVDQPMPTVPGINHHSLITPEQLLPECGFRMLEPRELKLGMSFPDAYIILGSKRDQVKQIGNAVCANVAEEIVRRCVESLS